MFPVEVIKSIFKGFDVVDFSPNYTRPCVSIEFITDSTIESTMLGTYIKRQSLYHSLLRKRLKKTDKYIIELESTIKQVFKQLQDSNESNPNLTIELDFTPAFIESDLELQIFFEIKGYYHI